MTTARIVAITLPRVEGINTPEEFIVYAARVSNYSTIFSTVFSAITTADK